MHKYWAFLFVVLGAIMILVSVLGLIMAFDVFRNLDSSEENFVYSFGSVLIPLLTTVTGRWFFRKGITRLRK